MHPQKKLKAAIAIGSKGTKVINKLNDQLQTKSVFYSYTNKLDRLISNNKNKHKLTSLDLINQTTKDGTPVTLASLYDPKDQSKIIKEHLLILIDSGASHSMAKASLVHRYKHSFFKKEKSSYKTAAGTFESKHSMKLVFTLDEFGRSTKLSHTFDLDESEDGIGYDMIIGRDLLNKLNIDVRFSN